LTREQRIEIMNKVENILMSKDFCRCPKLVDQRLRGKFHILEDNDITAPEQKSIDDLKLEMK
jgi:hypothetical protein